MAKAKATAAAEVALKGKQLHGDTAQFTKAQILTFERYRGRRDLLAVLLTDDRVYSLSAADAAIETFMKEKVN